ncbi:MAG TPA: hypothetical protein VMT89_19115 [Candidatus Acidoferrales bacterium]|nr:hypothetical protein [Candidatus Acidoferrales bacterium]
MGRRLWIAAAAVSLLWRATLAADLKGTPTAAPFGASDEVTIAEMALQWAMDGGIADFHLVKDPNIAIVADLNLPKNAALKLTGHKVSLLSMQDIQSMADEHGDLLYFRFAPFKQRDERIDVPISLVWAVGAKSTTIYMSGGGATLSFKRQNGKWVLLPVTEHWMSMRRHRQATA